MTRIEQRICDRCFDKDDGMSDHGWHQLEVNDADVDLCRPCSRDFILWVGTGRPAPGPTVVGLEA